MNADVVKTWVRAQKKWGSIQYAGVGALALVAGLLVLFLTFWLAYGVIWIGTIDVSSVSEIVFSTKLHLTHNVRLICAGVFVVLLCIQYVRTNPLYWGDYPEEDYNSLSSFAGGFVECGILLSHPRASANMITDILMTGPRLVAGSGEFFKRGICLRRLDENSCSDLLLFLCGQARSVPYEELKAAGWEAWFEQLRCIEGVQFLPKGISLTPDLRQEFVEMKET